MRTLVGFLVVSKSMHQIIDCALLTLPVFDAAANKPEASTDNATGLLRALPIDKLASMTFTRVPLATSDAAWAGSLGPQLTYDEEASVALVRQAIALKRFDVAVLPVVPESLSWTRVALANANKALPVPLLLLAHNLEAPALRDLLRFGAADFILAPFGVEELKTRLLQWGNKRARASQNEFTDATYSSPPAGYYGVPAAPCRAASGWLEEPTSAREYTSAANNTYKNTAPMQMPVLYKERPETCTRNQEAGIPADDAASPDEAHIPSEAFEHGASVSAAAARARCNITLEGPGDHSPERVGSVLGNCAWNTSGLAMVGDARGDTHRQPINQAGQLDSHGMQGKAEGATATRGGINGRIDHVVKFAGLRHAPWNAESTRQNADAARRPSPPPEVIAETVRQLTAPPPVDNSYRATRAQVLARFEREYVTSMLLRYRGNVTHAARAGNQDRRAFWQLMRKYQILSADFRTGRQTPPSGSR